MRDFTYHTDFPKKILQKSYSFGWVLTPPPKLILKTCFLGVVDPQEQHLLDQKRNSLSHFRIKFSVGRIQLSYIHSTTFHGKLKKCSSFYISDFFQKFFNNIFQRNFDLFFLLIFFFIFKT